MPLILAAAIVAFAWFAFGSLSAVLLITAKLTAVFFFIAGAGELSLVLRKVLRTDR